MSNILEKWEDLKNLVDMLEVDITKAAGGNKAAGTRSRKGLRAIKNGAAELVKLTLGKE
tara:strand:- start:56 stop:232 length:177 start_codon:yes stop_codon:yes gene_type:complete